jgi:hypothetical protein
VRPAAGIAYTLEEEPHGSEQQSQEVGDGVHAMLVERIARELDPNGVLAA